MNQPLTCARCRRRRRIKGAYSWHMGHPFGPVCAKKMDLARETKDRAAKVVRDTETRDLFATEGA